MGADVSHRLWLPFQKALVQKKTKQNALTTALNAPCGFTYGLTALLVWPKYVTSCAPAHSLISLHYTEMRTFAIVHHTLLVHFWKKSGKQNQLSLTKLYGLSSNVVSAELFRSTLTDLTVLATEVWLAQAKITVDPIFTHTSILTGGWLTLVAIYTRQITPQVQRRLCAINPQQT